MSSRVPLGDGVAIVRTGDGGEETTAGEAPLRPSTLPPFLRFPLVVVLSLSLSSLLYSLIAGFNGSEQDLARVRRRLDSWWDVGALVGWRMFELGLGWFGNYDSYDLAALSLLSHSPPLYLLGTFYSIRSSTVVTSLVIDSLATYIPFRLLRPLSRAHAVTGSSNSAALPNKVLVTDPSIQILTTILAASIYDTTLFGAHKTYLTTYLVTYFTGIPSITAAYSATPFTLFPTTLLLGLAAKSFIYTPTAAVGPTPEDSKLATFDPASATLVETFWYNAWGYSSRAKVAIQRTATLVLVSGANTFVQTYVTVQGVEALGALAYSGVWVVAAAVTGISLGVVGAV
ncbi:hypothetical protein BJ875DRAFT_380437 [Amylocarpus encephaloides]|uniref:Uncharacterized protein n=1 Tax=Amylocarpus encephaloides TaxID=45428 RepID=A0A9P7YF61_9HELO|nr:hypothetical protein BJ875DRAFT_380437 [Amylocarpus encephaloides]